MSNMKSVIYAGSVIAVLGGIILLGENTKSKEEKYIINEFPNATEYYENIVTNNKNDFFIVDEKGTTYYIEVLRDENKEYNHKITELSEETDDLNDMNDTSVYVDNLGFFESLNYKF